MFHLPFYYEVMNVTFYMRTKRYRVTAISVLIQQKQKLPSKPKNENKFAKPTYYL